MFVDVEAVNAMGTAILMVEQNARKALSIAETGYVLDQGTVAYADDAGTLLDDSEVSELYLGG